MRAKLQAMKLEAKFLSVCSIWQFGCVAVNDTLGKKSLSLSRQGTMRFSQVSLKGATVSTVSSICSLRAALINSVCIFATFWLGIQASHPFGTTAIAAFTSNFMSLM